MQIEFPNKLVWHNNCLCKQLQLTVFCAQSTLDPSPAGIQANKHSREFPDTSTNLRAMASIQVESKPSVDQSFRRAKLKTNLWKWTKLWSQRRKNRIISNKSVLRHQKIGSYNYAKSVHSKRNNAGNKETMELYYIFAQKCSENNGCRAGTTKKTKTNHQAATMTAGSCGSSRAASVSFLSFFHPFLIFSPLCLSFHSWVLSFVESLLSCFLFFLSIWVPSLLPGTFRISAVWTDWDSQQLWLKAQALWHRSTHLRHHRLAPNLKLWKTQ